jgi:hypothetical protein
VRGPRDPRGRLRADGHGRRSSGGDGSLPLTALAASARRWPHRERRVRVTGSCQTSFTNSDAYWRARLRRQDRHRLTRPRCPGRYLLRSVTGMAWRRRWDVNPREACALRHFECQDPCDLPAPRPCALGQKPTFSKRVQCSRTQFVRRRPVPVDEDLQAEDFGKGRRPG